MVLSSTVLPVRRTRKLALLKSFLLHEARPHLSLLLPRVTIASLVVRVGVVLDALHELPPSQDSCAAMVPAAVEPESSSLIVMPPTVVPVTAKPWLLKVVVAPFWLVVARVPSILSMARDCIQILPRMKDNVV